MAKKKRPLIDTVWSRLDRKATAILEFTLRQYRTRLSTWTVLGTGAMIVLMVMLFYIDGMNREIEAIDNDNDSFDHDGDGYPTGQELKHGTDPYWMFSHPGQLDPPISPEPASAYVNEDDFDWSSSPSLRASNGFDDDGDCTRLQWSFERDDNRNGVPCDAFLEVDGDGDIYVDSDPSVDEDPDEEAYYRETLHRGFVLGFGKIGFVFILGIFLPLFLATGLVRDEMSSGTLHYLVSKPISRAELLLYRLLGFIMLSWPYLAVLVFLSALVSGLLGPSEGFFRFGDLLVWFGILLASWMMTLVYATIFMTMGVVHRYGVIAAILLGVWEFSMAMLSAFSPGTTAARLSLIHWGMVIVDGFGTTAWPDSSVLVALGRSVTIPTMSFGIARNDSLQGADVLASFAHSTSLTGGPLLDAIISIFILLMISASTLFVAQAIFKGKEID